MSPEIVHGDQFQGPHPATWDILDRYPDRRDKNGDIVRAGDPKRTIANAVRVIETDPRWNGVDHDGALTVQRNTFSGQIEIRGQARTDALEVSLAVWLDTHYGMSVSPRMVSDATLLVAQRNPYHPVREYLSSIEWDGEPRAETLAARYLGAEPTELAAEIGRCFLVSAVARVMKPGCKVDTTVVLVGKQGARKSSAVRSLAVRPEWYSPTPFLFGSKDAYQNLPGVWLYELAELATMRPSTVDSVKAFLSAKEDRYRPSYGRNVCRVPRQTIFVGTVNEQEFLHDPTGARRFWPLRVGQIALDELERDRDQLWGEALWLYTRGSRWWMGEEMEDELREDQDQHQGADPWEDPVLVYLSGQTGFVSTSDILDRAISIDVDRQTKAASMRLSRIMSAAGWLPTRGTVSGARVRGYRQDR